MQHVLACACNVLVLEVSCLSYLRPLDEGALLRVLEERGLVDEVLKTVNLSSNIVSPLHLPPHASSYQPAIHEATDERLPPRPDQTTAAAHHSVARATKSQDSMSHPGKNELSYGHVKAG